METPNLSYIETLAAGDSSFKTQLISIVKAELPLEIEEYKTNIESENWKNTAENVHKLKHKISILGLEKAYYLAIDYEEQLLEGKVQLKEKFEDILLSMSEFVETL